MEKDQAPPKRKPRAERVRAEFPVRVGHLNGFTRDISTTGVFLELPEVQEMGAEVNIEIELDTPGGARKMKLTGVVVRLEQSNGRMGMGVKISNQELS